MNHQTQVQTYLQAKHAYYNGTPIMSDDQFDELEDKIRLANPQEPALKITGTPLPKESPRKKVKHRLPMGSQEKVNSYADFTRWERLRANNKNALFHVS